VGGIQGVLVQFEGGGGGGWGGGGGGGGGEGGGGGVGVVVGGGWRWWLWAGGWLFGDVVLDVALPSGAQKILSISGLGEAERRDRCA